LPPLLTCNEDRPDLLIAALFVLVPAVPSQSPTPPLPLAHKMKWGLTI
jgi:hypothetical protein